MVEVAMQVSLFFVSSLVKSTRNSSMSKSHGASRRPSKKWLRGTQNSASLADLAWRLSLLWHAFHAFHGTNLREQQPFRVAVVFKAAILLKKRSLGVRDLSKFSPNMFREWGFDLEAESSQKVGKTCRTWTLLLGSYWSYCLLNKLGMNWDKIETV